MNTKSFLLAGMLLMANSFFTPVLADDFGVWTDADLSQKIGKTGFTAGVDLGFRANNHLKSVDRWSLGGDLSYDFCKYFRLGVGYDYIYRYNFATSESKYNDNNVWKGYNLNNGNWRSKNRFHVDARGSVSLGDFTFSLRERYQLTRYNPSSYRRDRHRFNVDNTGAIVDTLDTESETIYKENKTEHYLKSMATVEYNIPKCPVNPFMAFEVSNNLSNGFSCDCRRYYVGADWKINKGQHLELCYIYNNGNGDDEEGNIHVIAISYKIKGLFSKKSK